MSLDVHIGKDGWLFLSGGSNAVMAYFTDAHHFDAGRKQWVALIRSRTARAKAIGARYLHFIVPDKLNVYPEHCTLALPHAKSTPSQSLGLALKREWASGLSKSFLDFLEVLQTRKRETAAPLYYKTDAHWTFEGAYAAYEAICERLGARVNADIPKASALSGDLFLDLGSKLDPPVKETFSTHMFAKNAARTFANSLVAYKEETNQPNAGGLHVGSHVVFENKAPGADPRTIVLFGDSYSEYRPHLLTGMLAETFAHTHYIWSTNIDWTYIESVRPDIVLTEIAERFMTWVPADDFNLTHFAQNRLAAHLKEKS